MTFIEDNVFKQTERRLILTSEFMCELKMSVHIAYA